ncbi:hypothetical protein [Streptomyces sp. S4.7]|nr:hypothetical protein [Streptomyces sp. S4.7]
MSRRGGTEPEGELVPVSGKSLSGRLSGSEQVREPGKFLIRNARIERVG